MAKSAAKANAPVFTMRRKGVSVSVFENHTEKDGRDITFFKTTIQRTYKDDAGEFKTTNSYSLADLFVLDILSGEAKKWILEAESKQNKDAE